MRVEHEKHCKERREKHERTRVDDRIQAGVDEMRIHRYEQEFICGEANIGAQREQKW